MEKILNEITEFVNQCLGLLGSQPVSSQVSDLQSNIITIVMQLGATLVLFLVIRFTMWEKLTKLIEARQAAVTKELEDARADRQKAMELLLEKDKEYQEAKTEVKHMISAAVKEGNMQKEKIIADAKAEAQRRLNNADEEIKSEISKARKEIKDSIVDVAFAAAEKIVKAEIDRDKHQDIVKNFIEEVGK